MSDQGAGNIPVTGDEHVLLQNDEGAWIGEASTQQIADLAPGGSGDLTTAVILAPATPTRNVIQPTDVSVTALTLTPPTGSYDEGSLPYFRVTGEDGQGLDTFAVDNFGSVTLRATNETLPNQPWFFACISQPNQPVTFFEILDHQVIIKAMGDSSTDPFAVQDGNEVDMLRCTKPDVGTSVVVSATATGDVPLTVYGFTDQEADLQRWQSPDRTTTLARIGVAGAIGTSAGEPADADINPGECFRYFIATNGAAKVGFKGKTEDGTVVKREDAIAP